MTEKGEVRSNGIGVSRANKTIGVAYGDTGVASNDRHDDFWRLGQISNDLGDES